MAQNIIFTNTSNSLELEQPRPASELIPDWYKNMQSYVGNEKKPDGTGDTTGTIKRCMPVFDAMTAGYIIPLPADVYVSIKEYEARDSATNQVIDSIPTKMVQHFEWSDFGLVDFHAVEQAPTHPARNEHAYPKWINPWAIRTPKGYSTLFVQPFHRDLPFTILSGVVDTDEYYAPVNFPMVINDPKFEGLIPMGTPIAQVIPFKRDNWKMIFGEQEEYYAQLKIRKKLHTKFFDKYKTMFRAHKEYK